MPYCKALDLLVIAAAQARKGQHEDAAKTFAAACVAPSLLAGAKLVASYNEKATKAQAAGKTATKTAASTKAWPFSVVAENLMPEDDGTVGQELRMEVDESEGLREHQTAEFDDDESEEAAVEEDAAMDEGDKEECAADEDEPNAEDAAAEEDDKPMSEEEKSVAIAAVKRLRAAKAATVTTVAPLKTVAGKAADAGADKFSRVLRNVLASHEAAAKKKKKPAPKKK